MHEHFGVPFVGSVIIAHLKFIADQALISLIQELSFNEKPMFDPMSLVDFGVQSGATLVCKIQGAAAGGEI